jgi:hypothetical protein
MTFTTKYDIGQIVYFFYINRSVLRNSQSFDEDKEVVEGTISGVHFTDKGTEYRITIGFGYEWLQESEILTERPFFENRYHQFFDQYPEFDEHDREYLSGVISERRRAAKSRIARTSNQSSTP